MDQATRATTPSKTTSMHCVRHIVVEAKQRPLSPGHRLPNRIVRQIPQPSSLSLSLLPLSVWIDLQEPMCCLWAIPRVPSMFQGITSESPGGSQECLSAWVTWCLSLAVLSHGALAACVSGPTSHFGCNCWDGWPFCAISCTERSLGPKGQCQPVTLSTPFYGR